MTTRGANRLAVPMSLRQVERSLAASVTGHGRSKVGEGFGGEVAFSKASLIRNFSSGQAQSNKLATDSGATAAVARIDNAGLEAR